MTRERFEVRDRPLGHYGESMGQEVVDTFRHEHFWQGRPESELQDICRRLNQAFRDGQNDGLQIYANQERKRA
jgi:hypothetical protein